MSIPATDVVVTVTGPETVEVAAGPGVAFPGVVAHVVEKLRPKRADGVRVVRGFLNGRSGTRLLMPRAAADSLGWLTPAEAPKKRAPRRKASKPSAEVETPPDTTSAEPPTEDSAEGDTAAADQEG